MKFESSPEEKETNQEIMERILSLIDCKSEEVPGYDLRDYMGVIHLKNPYNPYVMRIVRYKTETNEAEAAISHIVAHPQNTEKAQLLSRLSIKRNENGSLETERMFTYRGLDEDICRAIETYRSRFEKGEEDEPLMEYKEVEVRELEALESFISVSEVTRVK